MSKPTLQARAQFLGDVPNPKTPIAELWMMGARTLLDEALAEIERLNGAFSEGRNAPLELQMRTAEALDAERYRYLRNAAGRYMTDEDGPTVCSGLGDLFEYHFGSEVDEVVDAAIARWKAAGSPLPKEAK